MANIKLIYDNVADAATFAGSAASGYPATNLADGNISKPWRSTALPGTKSFTATLASTVTLSAIDLVNVNFTTAATVRLRLRASSGGSDLLDTTFNALQMTFNGAAPSDWGSVYDVIQHFTPVAGVGYVMVDITDAANPAGYVQVGRVFLGRTSFQPAKNAEFGLSDGWTDMSTIVRTNTGKKLYSELPKVRDVAFNFPRLTEAEGDQLHELVGSVGLTREVLYLPDPSDMAKCQRYGFLGTLEQLDRLQFPMVGTRGKAFQIQKKQ